MPAVPASVKLTAFICPHCSTHTTQYWYEVHARSGAEENSLPLFGRQGLVDAFEVQVQLAKTSEERDAHKRHVKWAQELLLGNPFLEKSGETAYNAQRVYNLSISKCYECSKLSVWVHDKLLYPPAHTGPAPNADLPADILRDYEEASTILSLSPRGAAALLRLAIEKLVTYLGAQGANINAKIAWLVANGLPEQIHQALDAVRVIGNEAVHPGQIDLRDDRDTAAELFELVNIIAEEKITRPKRIKAAYDKIPAKAKTAIEERNSKALNRPK